MTTSPLNELKEKVREQAEAFINTEMPKKALELDHLVKTELFTRSLDEIEKVTQDDYQSIISRSKECVSVDSCESATKKRKIEETESAPKENEAEKTPKVRLPSNHLIVTALSALKKELIEMVNNVGTVKLWIQLNIPKIEDGNNFGVSIQEEIVDELGRAEDSAFNGLEGISKYFVARAKLTLRINKYPFIEDFFAALCELDQKEYFSLKLAICDLRNNYAILYDMITKNQEKIRKPRGTHNHMAHIY